MFSRIRSARGPLAVLTAVVALGAGSLLSACGADLGKSNYPRATVSVQPGSDQAPSGKITDAAVAPAALRTVDPCPLVGAELLTDLGTGGQPERYGLDRCSAKVTDAGGKTVQVSLQLGESIATDADDATGNVGGLPLIEKKEDGGVCTVTAVTGKDPDLGIAARVTYQGGDACRAGRTLMDKVVQKLHQNPARQQQPPGSLVAVDPCAAVDDSAVAGVAPGTTKTATGLHGCQWNGDSRLVLLTIREGSPPIEDAENKKVDLGGGVTGFQEIRVANSASCDLTWAHRSISDSSAELVAVHFENTAVDADPAKEDACGKAVTLAKNAVTILPKP